VRAFANSRNRTSQGWTFLRIELAYDHASEVLSHCVLAKNPRLNEAMKIDDEEECLIDAPSQGNSKPVARSVSFS